MRYFVIKKCNEEEKVFGIDANWGRESNNGANPAQ